METVEKIIEENLKDTNYNYISISGFLERSLKNKQNHLIEEFLQHDKLNLFDNSVIRRVLSFVQKNKEFKMFSFKFENILKERTWQDNYINWVKLFLSKTKLYKLKETKFKKHKFYQNFDHNKIEECYLDQAMRSVNVYDRNIFSAYTSYGIKLIDSFYSEEIRKIGTKEQKIPMEDLKEAILKNPHLHHVVKYNLISNLNNYVTNN